MVNVVQDVVDMIGYINDAAGSFPTSVILLVVGSLFIVFSVFLLVYFTAGALVESLIPESLGRKPPQQD